VQEAPAGGEDAGKQGGKAGAGEGARRAPPGSVGLTLPLPPRAPQRAHAHTHPPQEDAERGAHMPILLHGDGAFSGQGIVYETLDMSGLPDYTVGGCIHLVVNNQARWRRRAGGRAVVGGCWEG